MPGRQQVGEHHGAYPGWLGSLVALLLLTPLSALGADAAFWVTYEDGRSSAIDAVRQQLQHEAAGERAAARAGGIAGFRVQLLQEEGRPERWVLLQWADDAARLAASRHSGATDVDWQRSMLVAPPDIHRNHRLPAIQGAPGQGCNGRQADGRGASYEVTHLDIGAAAGGQGPVIAALMRLLRAARAAPANLCAEAWQQDAHPNHYALLLVWRTRAARQAFVAGPVARQFRAQVGPMLGAPYDDRLYRRVD